MAALPHVTRVLSPTNVRDLEGDALGPVPVVPYAEVRAGTLRPEALGERLGSHPIFGGLLVAKDARTAAILIELEPLAGAADSRPGLVMDLRRLASEAGPGLRAFIAGIQSAISVWGVIPWETLLTTILLTPIALRAAGGHRHPLDAHRLGGCLCRRRVES
ncbi:MAG TPA: hypothetical protein VEO73_07365 [Gemmatimonadales bacterium]|nr:hypothetical protein [Gemmatimonadales bacterium]